jgi:EF hand.
MKLGMTDEEISDVIKHIDKTKDGNIDYNEFLAALKL